MDEQRFWNLIADVRNGDPGMDGEAVGEGLEARLSQLSAGEIEDFERLWQQKMVESYRWDLWGAAYVINGGCSDDCFDYFRGFLISSGQQTFEQALKSPDALIDFPGEDDFEWEGPSYAASAAYEQVTGGKALPAASPKMPAEPAGTAWEEDDLPSLFPRLAEKHGF